MTRVALLMAASVVWALTALPASADEGDQAMLNANSALIGEQLRLTLEVLAPEGATVEVDSGASSWGPVQFVRVESQSARPEGDQTRHTLVLVVAGFRTGEIAFRPGVHVVQGNEVTPREMPSVPLTITPTLRDDEPNELSPIAGPVAVSGAESPLLRPAVGAGSIAGLTLLSLGAWYLVRRWRSRPRPVIPVPASEPAMPSLLAAEAAIDTDPVAAYRHMAVTIRNALTLRHGIPAVALTSGEIANRMESAGLDRWQARLVSGLLSECDAVIYAGYRPAAERRQHDLTMAREILEANA